MHDKKEATQQIIGASTNLLGVCVVIVTALKVSGFGGTTFIDEAAAFSSSLFLISCIFAYFSLRRDGPNTGLYRDIADYFFLAGIVLLGIGVLVLAFTVIG